MHSNRLSLAGVFAPVALLAVAVGGVLAAPSYRWPTDPVSEVGTHGDALALAFNAGLVLAGALILAFSWRLWRAGRPAVAGTNALAGVGILGAGVFPGGSGLHAVAALYFATAWLPPVLAGYADWRAGARRTAVAAVVLGVAAVAIWLPYDVGPAWARVGYGAAELVTFTAWGAWSAWTASRLRAAPETNAAGRGRTAA